MVYSLRQTERKNYMEIGKVQLPRRTWLKSKDDLYAVEVIEEETQEGKVKCTMQGMARVMMSGWTKMSLSSFPSQWKVCSI